jgi:hypothetical protein
LLQDSLGNDVVPECFYQVVSEQLPMLVESQKVSGDIFAGHELMGIAMQDWSQAKNLKAAKRLLRPWLHFYCKGKPLKSRELFIK